MGISAISFLIDHDYHQSHNLMGFEDGLKEKGIDGLLQWLLLHWVRGRVSTVEKEGGREDYKTSCSEQWKKGETHQDGLKEKVLGKTTMEMGLKRRYWVVGLFVGLMGRDKKAKGTCHLAAVAFSILGQVDLTRNWT
eukprot:TRINITY_DN16170_c0_g1_i2.p1 TRINITY_DN16170_c0_g1~~TRINITY_DN16170_c0_g1_i2.p1  ORF type:complete len:137 (-),score=25.14 TRINITY_DN16170_c0_g1_i2:378-788(-)